MTGEIYAKVNRKFNERKSGREALIEERKRFIYSKIPRIEKIDGEISSLAVVLLEDVAAGKDPDTAVSEFALRLNELNDEKKALLSKAGYRPDFLEVPYKCGICRDTGLDGDARCRCYSKLLYEELMNESNLSEMMKKQNFASFSLEYYRDEKKRGEVFPPRENMKSIFDECVQFAEDFEKTHKNLFLYGASGLGKTFLSSAIANRAIERGLFVVYQSAGDLFSRLEDIRFGRVPSEKNPSDAIYGSELLIIDDLGTELINPFSETELFKIINTRLLTSKSTIISANLSLADVGKKYSDRILSRIMGEYSNLRFYGEDIRTLNN